MKCGLLSWEWEPFFGTFEWSFNVRWGRTDVRHPQLESLLPKSGPGNSSGFGRDAVWEPGVPAGSFVGFVGRRSIDASQLLHFFSCRQRFFVIKTYGSYKAEGLYQFCSSLLQLANFIDHLLSLFATKKALEK